MAVSHVQASSSRPPSAAGTASSNGGPAYHGLSHLDAYTEGELIGQGSFGVIHKVTRKSDGMQLARKQLNFSKMTQRDKQQLVAEVNILSRLQHPNIVGFIERILDQDRGIIHIIMEYCGGGDLSHLIRECERTGRNINEDIIWDYFYQIASALKHCHSGGGATDEEEQQSEGRPPSRGATATRRRDSGKDRERVLHRDLKPDNVFLDDSRQNVKLGDFGLSKALGAATFANTYVGTPYYMSPELFNESSYDSKSDIWALGCVIYEMVALHPPFHQAKTHNDLANQLRSKRIPPLPRKVSSELTRAIARMLEFEPKNRPSATELLNYPRMQAVQYKRWKEAHSSGVALREQRVSDREQVVLSREQAVRKREEACARLEQALTDAKLRDLADREADRKSREAFKLEAKRWEEEKRATISSSAAVAQQQQQLAPLQAVRRPSTGAHSIAGEQSPTDMDGVMDIPGSGIKAVGSRVPRRSFVPKPLEERNLPNGTHVTRNRDSCVYDLDTPTKPAISAANFSPSSLRRAGTPSRLASKSMGNLAAAARADRARVDSPSDFMADTTMASVQSSVRRGGLHQSTIGQPRPSSSLAQAPRRPSPPNPFLGTGPERAERPPSRPALPTTSSSGFHLPSSASSSALASIERQLYPGSPARWLDKENEAEIPSPFLRKMGDVLGPAATTTSSSSSSGGFRPSMPRSRSTAGLTAQAGSNVPSSGASNGNNLARLVTIGNAMRNEARPPVTSRSSRIGAMPGAYERRDSIARADQAIEEASRVMAGH